jgi:hypothetical protein
MMMNGGNMQQRGMPKNGRNSLHSGSGGKRPPIVLPTRERTKNAETETKSSIKFDDDKMMMAMVWKRVEMMSECRGAAGEAGKIKMEEMHSGQIRRWHNVYICKTLI